MPAYPELLLPYLDHPVYELEYGDGVITGRKEISE
jgi:hypothetical protein